MTCELILQWSATPEELTGLRGALWRWCNRAAGPTSIYQCLDNQGLADLIAGRFPASSQTPWRADRRGVHFQFQAEAFHDRQATIGSRRRDIPVEGVEDIVKNGKCWELID
jgi:hypothetical protein